MAIDVPIGPALVVASGSVGDTTYGHNQWGPWTRPRATPADPATDLQVYLRDTMTWLSQRWSNDLTESERESWGLYSKHVRLRGRTGRANHVGGQQMYVRSNTPRVQAQQPTLLQIDQAPNLFDLGPYSPLPRIVLNVVDQTFHPFFDDSDTWATETGAAMLFWASPAAPLTVNFHKGPYRYAGPLLGSDPRNTSPGTLPLPFAATATDRVFLRGRVTRADARLTESFRLPAVIVDQVAPLPVSAVFDYQTPVFSFLRVTFDALIRFEPHSTGNWFVRYNDGRWSVNAITTIDDQLRLTIRPTAIQIGPDVVTFTPPPNDVNGLLTGLPVAPFSIPIT